MLGWMLDPLYLLMLLPAMLLAGVASLLTRSTFARYGREAAFLTYVASAFTAIMTLLYYMLRAGLLGGRDD